MLKTHMVRWEWSVRSWPTIYYIKSAFIRLLAISCIVAFYKSNGFCSNLLFVCYLLLHTGDMCEVINKQILC